MPSDGMSRFEEQISRYAYELVIGTTAAGAPESGPGSKKTYRRWGEGNNEQLMLALHHVSEKPLPWEQAMAWVREANGEDPKDLAKSAVTTRLKAMRVRLDQLNMPYPPVIGKKRKTMTGTSTPNSGSHSSSQHSQKKSKTKKAAAIHDDDSDGEYHPSKKASIRSTAAQKRGHPLVSGVSRTTDQDDSDEESDNDSTDDYVPAEALGHAGNGSAHASTIVEAPAPAFAEAVQDAAELDKHLAASEKNQMDATADGQHAAAAVDQAGSHAVEVVETAHCSQAATPESAASHAASPEPAASHMASPEPASVSHAAAPQPEPAFISHMVAPQPALASDPHEFLELSHAIYGPQTTATEAIYDNTHIPAASANAGTATAVGSSSLTEAEQRDFDNFLNVSPDPELPSAAGDGADLFGGLGGSFDNMWGGFPSLDDW